MRSSGFIAALVAVQLLLLDDVPFLGKLAADTGRPTTDEGRRPGLIKSRQDDSPEKKRREPFPPGEKLLSNPLGMFRENYEMMS